MITVAGEELTEPWATDFVEGHIHTAAGLPAEAYLRFKDDKHRMPKAAGVVIGTPVTVSITAGEPVPRKLFDGEVTALEATVDTLGICTVVKARDRAHRLQRGRQIASYTDQTLREIAAQAAQRAGLRLGTVEGSKWPLPYVAQPNLSDWELLQSLAVPRDLLVEVEGEVLHLRPFEKADGAPKPSEGSAGSPYVLQRGTNSLTSLTARLDSTDQVREVTVRGWNPQAKKALEATAAATTSPRVKPGTSNSSVVAAFRGTPVLPVLPVTDRDPVGDTETRETASALAGQKAATLAHIEAEGAGNPRLSANTPIALAGVGAALTGKYTLTACRHVFDSLKGYYTRIWVGPLPQSPVPPTAPAMIAQGLATAVVTDCKELAGGQHGWVRLKLPWLSDNYVTDWTRTVQYGGTHGGGVITPDVDDEVLIGFEHGRLDRPYVIGSLYNGSDQPGPHTGPLIDPNTGHVNRRSLASRAGDRLELLDSKEHQGALLASGDGKTSIRLDRADTTLTLASDGTVTVKAGKELHLQAGEDGITLTGATIALNATKKLTLTTGTEGKSGELEIAGATININAQEKLSATGGTTSTLNLEKNKATLNAPQTNIN
ncbi:VgrG-related protein [Streptomyces sp. NPDC057743]|uniref:VgrG-related protein n=1 Tax=Streptomyces sp. NPDC057743 TaxID=3346236 RepID=UPI0036A06943